MEYARLATRRHQDGDAAPRVRLWWAYRLMFRHRGQVPAALLTPTLPAAVLGAGLLVALLRSHDAVVVNTQLVLLGSPPRGWLVGGVVVAALGAYGLAVGMLCATRLAGGAALGHPQRLWPVLRGVLRRWWTPPGLVAVGALLVALPVAALVGTLRVAITSGLAVPVALVVLLVAVTQVSLLVPAMAVEGRGLFGALRRTRRLTSGHGVATALRLLLYGHLLPFMVLVVVKSVIVRAGTWIWPGSTAMVDAAATSVLVLLWWAAATVVPVEAMCQRREIGNLDEMLPMSLGDTWTLDGPRIEAVYAGRRRDPAPGCGPPRRSP
jgi:hypothetical protein